MSREMLRSIATETLNAINSTASNAHLGVVGGGADSDDDIVRSSMVDNSASASQWPDLSRTQLYAIAIVNLGAFFLSWVLLRVIWPPPSAEQLRAAKDVEIKISAIKNEYHSINNPTTTAPKELIECIEGESAGEYDTPWTQTFDLWFVILMLTTLVMLIIWTYFTAADLFVTPSFWLGQIPKVGCMMLVSFLGGLLCRYFCETDSKGYIITNKHSAFKVNYTRKLQHFAAYLVPLVFHGSSSHSGGPLALSWGNWFTMIGFLVLIKPIRERFSFIMLQFNSLDRPEDRPNTLSWIVGGNILPGAVMIIFFRWLYSYTGQSDMTYIFLFITGIGDGFAEPVGIYLGKHKYWVAGIGSDRKYQRSWEGSACVFLSSVMFVSLFWYTFKSASQFWVAMVVMPPLMAYAEATSPHTIDTPFLMGLGGLALWLISHVEVLWF